MLLALGLLELIKTHSADESDNHESGKLRFIGGLQKAREAQDVETQEHVPASDRGPPGARGQEGVSTGGQGGDDGHLHLTSNNHFSSSCLLRKRRLRLLGFRAEKFDSLTWSAHMLTRTRTTTSTESGRAHRLIQHLQASGGLMRSAVDDRGGNLGLSLCIPGSTATAMKKSKQARPLRGSPLGFPPHGAPFRNCCLIKETIYLWGGSRFKALYFYFLLF